jgi:O-antigen ligase
MRLRYAPSRSFDMSVPFILLLVFLLVLWIAGGASRADAFGQVVVRASSILILIILVVVGQRPPSLRAKPVCWILFASAVLVLLQLVPLPPSIWQALPGRELLAEAALAAGEEQPWRPWSIVPGATANAAFSLVVPLTMLLLLEGLRPEEQAWMPVILLTAILIAALVALLQFSGVSTDNPFVNDSPGQVSGPLANRNHLALLLALGCVIAPVWAFAGGRPRRRLPFACGLILLFALMILAIGSRSGLVVGIVGIMLGLAITRNAIGRELRNAPPWLILVLVASILAVVAAFVMISVLTERTESLDRALSDELGDGRRGEAWPLVVAMIQAYFPAGSGFGSFDPVFRIHEPFDFLSLKYFNHAHNDFLEIILDSGIFGLALMLAAFGWIAVASARAWRAAGRSSWLQKLGSSILLLVALASLLDYPARTPMFMAIVVLAGFWLATAVPERAHPALPQKPQHL